MIPAALLIIIGFVGLVIWGGGHFARQRLSTNSRLKKLETDNERVKELLADVILGHPDQARLKEALRTMFDGNNRLNR